ncbi:hypothetical protein Y032_0201g1719 [Ancylostoma ceylanicum]|uniref:Riboflavin transporter n=1 Tax=Ancylostoma ceylanicum TaxID=53326 RepID=A0A016SN56_9BILA|nr:hypothetical protein Y032_0201g1719 [Ancylostoma ceylanicum]
MDAATIAHLGAPRRLEFTQLPLRSRADWMYWTADLYDSAQRVQIRPDSTHKSYSLLFNISMCLSAREVGKFLLSNEFSGLAFFWKNTAVIGNRSYSVALYLLLLGLAVVDAISNVLFMPFMAKFHPSYLNAYFVGMGFSSLIPSILAIIQGTSTYKCEGGVPHYSQPLFSTAVFFGIIFVSNCISAVAFILLYRLADKKEPTEEPPESDGETRHNTAEVSSSTERMLSPSPEPLPKSYFALVLFTVTLINAQMNGIIPSISSYAALPYSQNTYHYSITLSNIMMPAASFLSFFLIFKKISILMVLSAMSTCATAFLVYLAALSPSLIFDSRSVGSALSITASLLAAGLHSYLRVSFASRLRDCDNSESRLLWCGLFTQIGSFIGSMIMLPLVDIAHVFESAPPCQ